MTLSGTRCGLVRIDRARKEIGIDRLRGMR
jgi:hypothetical protein